MKRRPPAGFCISDFGGDQEPVKGRFLARRYKSNLEGGSPTVVRVLYGRKKYA